MKQNPSDPDIQTIYQRIVQRDLDLQPDFQRGEVWPTAKKQRLIDSILRDWHVPPIHVIESSDGRQEVLDGQQRLVAIRDFIENKFRVDGSIAPRDPTVAALSGMTFSQLPQAVKRRFNNYTLRVFRITEYETGEPGELFFRLNQPTSLTAAETRNAFFGKPRDQVRELVRLATDAGISHDTISMSPARMAYDDVIARFCATLECDSLLEKVTAGDVTTRYRRGDAFPATVVERAETALKTLGGAVRMFAQAIRLNKATMHTWLVFTASRKWRRPPGSEHLSNYVLRFEIARQAVRSSSAASAPGLSLGTTLDERTRYRALQLFNDRASSRVADVSSVVARDAMIWLVWIFDREARDQGVASQIESALRPALKLLRGADDETYASQVSEALEAAEWGRPL
jgi:hypothetical protein